MAKKQQGNKKTVVGGNLQRANNGGIIATDSARVSTGRSRMVTDNAAASFGRSVGPYAQGATEGGTYMPNPSSEYYQEDPYYSQYEDPIYAEQYFPDSYYPEEYYGDEYGDYYEDPYYYYDELGDIDGDDLGFFPLALGQIGAAGASTPAASTGGTGFWDGLSQGVGGILGGVGNLVGSLVNGVGNTVNSVTTPSGAIKPELQASINRLSMSADEIKRTEASKHNGGSGGIGKLIPLAALGVGGWMLFKAMKK